ncbi:DUF4156 domain-containing protein [Gallibacterium trehalosifermentans]|uniref:DUF4156 domain-containing protein n=1 Tax=Gallibacterium trehalosifermentans TaxID=516935 RepID=A0ABV6H2S1_9PAST
MKKYIILSILLSFILTGCVRFAPFSPKQLNQNAKGIATVRSIPFGCQFLGEVEGRDGYRDSHHRMRAPNLSEAREGALNDLRNNAAEIADNTRKRVVLRVMQEKATCFSPTGACHHMNEYEAIKDYSALGAVFECGNRK